MIRMVTGPDVPANSLFQQPWWLDATAPGSWAEVTVERGGNTVARLPYVLRRRGPLRVLTQPRYTPTLGPWVAREPGAKPSTALGDEHELLAALEAALPAAHAFRQSFAPTMRNALPFIWAGYQLDVRYTYRLSDLTSETKLWDGLSGNTRKQIRKARNRVKIRDDLGLDRFHRTWVKTFERQGLRPPDMATLSRIEEACAPRDARAMLFAVDEAERIHAVAYIVWDRSAAYYMFGGGDPELRASGAASLLLWEAIMRASHRCDLFDFEGSMLKPVERFFRDFGASQTPYLHVSRAGRAARTAFGLQAALSRLAERSRGGRSQSD
jgi:hypothetical protein